MDGRNGPSCEDGPSPLYFDAFRYRERILQFDAEVADGAVHLGVNRPGFVGDHQLK